MRYSGIEHRFPWYVNSFRWYINYIRMMEMFIADISMYFRCIQMIYIKDPSTIHKNIPIRYSFIQMFSNCIQLDLYSILIEYEYEFVQMYIMHANIHFVCIQTPRNVNTVLKLDLIVRNVHHMIQFVYTIVFVCALLWLYTESSNCT